jgi:hypothetical protein
MKVHGDAIVMAESRVPVLEDGRGVHGQLRACWHARGRNTEFLFLGSAAGDFPGGTFYGCGLYSPALASDDPVKLRFIRNTKPRAIYVTPPGFVLLKWENLDEGESMDIMLWPATPLMLQSFDLISSGRRQVAFNDGFGEVRVRLTALERIIEALPMSYKCNPGL